MGTQDLATIRIFIPVEALGSIRATEIRLFIPAEARDLIQVTERHSFLPPGWPTEIQAGQFPTDKGHELTSDCETNPSSRIERIEAR